MDGFTLLTLVTITLTYSVYLQYNTAHDDNINQTTHSIVIHPYSAVSVDQPILPVDTFTMLSAIKQSIQPIDHNAFDIDNDT